MAGRAEGTVKQLIEEKKDLETLLMATIGMMVARGTCDLEEILSLQKFAKENAPKKEDTITSDIAEIKVEQKKMKEGIEEIRKLVPKENELKPKEDIKEKGTAEGEVGPEQAKEKTE